MRPFQSSSRSSADLGDAKLAGAAGSAGFADLVDLLFDGFAQAFEFDQQNGGGIHGIAGVGGLLDHAQHDAVEHFDGGGRDGAGGDLGHAYRRSRRCES